MSREKHIHLIGICGTAMASLAGMLQQRGFRITGSDAAAYPPMSDFLASLDIAVAQPFAVENLQPQPDLVVVGNAISRGNVELEHVLDERIPFCSLPQILQDEFLRGKEVLVVAGTHGKTTTTSMLSWLFESAGLQPSFLIGGIAENFGSSFQLGQGKHFIIEGDEYDTAFFDKAPKFLHYHPDQLILTSLEFDHADIYPDLASIELQFRRLVNLVPRRGRICVEGTSPELRAVVAKSFCPVETFGLTPECDWCAGDIVWHDRATEFRAVHRGTEFARIRIPVAGRHNVVDALAAIALAYGCGVECASIVQALRSFQSVRRRMEIKGEVAGVLLVEDFAHHPTAIRLTLEAARTRWPGRKIWAAVEPRSNTMRRKVFQDALPDALACADAVLLGPVNRAQLLDEGERLSPEAIAESIRARGRDAQAFPSAIDIAEHVADHASSGDMLLILSNGSFDGLTSKVAEKLGTRAGVRG